MHRYRRTRGLPALLAILTVLGLRFSFANAEGVLDRPSVVREVEGLIAELDSDRYAVRRAAAERLEALARRQELGPLLAELFQRQLLRVETSLEVRTRLEQLGRDLPKVSVAPPDEVDDQEVRRLVELVEADSYAQRLGAAKRLEWLAQGGAWACRVMLCVKSRLADESIADDALAWLEPIYQKARQTWTTTNPAQWDLPPVAQHQIVQWVDELAGTHAGLAGPSGLRQKRVAARELWELIVRDEYVGAVREAVEAKLQEGGLDPAAVGRLQPLWDITRPAMVAEYWEGRKHGGVQRLVVGVPDQRPGAPAPSHFDRIDDEVAHCVSGSNLSPGEYPVGVAIPHPRNRNGAFFHLVNLPTPRRRLAYERELQTDEAVRLTQISRRTLDRWLRQKRSLEEHELMVLAHLDSGEVSRFAGEYFLLVEDQALGPPEIALAPLDSLPGVNAETEALQQVRLGGRPSRHGCICALLAYEGTKAALPGLLEALKKNRFLPPTPEGPYLLPWIAALGIAQRDPWPGVDGWLAGLLERPEALVEGQPEPPTLGATAAAVLLGRHGLDPIAFGLTSVRDALIERSGLSPCRFPSDEVRAKVERWWVACEAHPPDQHPAVPP